MNAMHIAGNSLVFNYYQEGTEKWIKDLGTSLKAQKLTEKIEYAKNFADGYAKSSVIEPGFTYRIVNYTLNSNLEYKRPPSEHFRIMLYFYELQFADKAYYKTGNTIIENTDQYYSIALMTNSFAHQNLVLQKGTVVKGLSVQLSEDWLNANINDFAPQQLQLLKQKDCVTGFITAKHRKILNDIFNSAANSSLPELFIKSRVLRLTEQFLNALCNRGLNDIEEFSNPKDFQAIIKIEQLLLNNYTTGFPTIESLAKTAYMSESKLKKLFKKAYGMAIYQYYQKNRMHKAKELLSGRKYSIGQVGTMLGYQNLSNFSAAFKKEFSYLPSECQEVL